MQQAAWRVDGASALLVGTEASVTLNHPSAGVEGFAGAGSAVFGVAPTAGGELAFVEAYCRGADLVARYAPSDGFPFRTEVYWRLESTPPLSPKQSRLTLIVSVETDLLDTHPELKVSSHAAGQARPLTAGASDDPVAARIELPGAGQWFEAVHPSDAREAELELTHEGGQARLAWRMFARFLEKGVIRRARFTGVRLPASAEPEACYQDFARQPPPLTV